jgi:archaemetzincin
VPPEICVINGSSLPERDLLRITPVVRDVFRAEVGLERATLDIARAYDRSRHQVNSTSLLAQILAGHTSSPAKKIAIVDADLFIPILTFVFGEAQLGGTAAIVSTHRLANDFYGLPRDPELMLQRLEKELVHELGHTFGLYHCRYFECVMRSSTYVEEIDMKRVELCSTCTATLSALCPPAAGPSQSV